MSEHDKALVKSFAGVLSVLVIVAIGFYFVADIVTSDKDEAGPNERMQAKIYENIKPVGEVNVGDVPAAAAAPVVAAGPRSGKDVYSGACMACHSTGVAGAPKVGDKAAWSPRASKGVDGLLKSAISGINAMPPKGTCAACSDDELKGAIEYMLKETGL
ncbi:cytochrome c5 [Thiogranum longum]|uniref:Cytochrome c5 n=1 Tax=Thiogranum longum TaxID=1537524 RepID=A0A4R1H9Z0_9GAMM|nr:c-type cytochrome [Thiogranum longum]TCK16965.1 cytochrome c5 [Thiogranum longum]